MERLTIHKLECEKDFYLEFECKTCINFQEKNETQDFKVANVLFNCDNMLLFTYKSMEPQCHVTVGSFTNSENKSGLLQGFSEVDGWRHPGGSMVSLITESWPGCPPVLPHYLCPHPRVEGEV